MGQTAGPVLFVSLLPLPFTSQATKLYNALKLYYTMAVNEMPMIVMVKLVWAKWSSYTVPITQTIQHYATVFYATIKYVAS